MKFDFSESHILNPILLSKYQALSQRLRDFSLVFIGFSGGVDSALLCAVARQLLGKENAHAVLAVGPSLAISELNQARELATLLDLKLIEYSSTEFSNPAYLANDPDRCYHCKNDLFQHLKEYAQTVQQANPLRIPKLLYGGNLDDTFDFRPGHRAAAEFGALAPMAEAQLSKAEIRQLSKIFGLPTWDKPAQPCLSSRIPYGSKVTEKKLGMVEAAEAALAKLGFREGRIRHFGECARVEVPKDELHFFEKDFVREEFAETLQRIGFSKMEIDPAGFRSGSLNEGLPELIILRA